MSGGFCLYGISRRVENPGVITFSKSSEPLGGFWIPEIFPRAAYLTGVAVGGGITFSLVRNIALEVDCLYFQKGMTLEIWDLDLKQFNVKRRYLD